jgi:hypothetical protein
MADWHILLGKLVAFHFVGNTVIFLLLWTENVKFSNLEKEENIAFLFTA